ncbi:MAG TPA: hypothetical protein PK079_25380 [Leptospiraceae bacterium]|nr:hypothetical protein [Leptospiraceae bacterium]HMW07316.1 hypothetical protein [Leptospiraceae bacterium]HMX34050.1 hypothetical protein [Leptospiraceae bacterium]HMY32976.1 hypothetical protein [Leptospiraceae bacterium]HMZ67457.1 hypothetical protein [Leptospiraceae bacterium]
MFLADMDIINYITNDLIHYFDIGYILLVVVTNFALLNKTSLKTKLTNPKKQFFKLGVAIVYAIFFLSFNYFSHGTKRALPYTETILVSLFVSLIIYETVARILKDKLKK